MKHVYQRAREALAAVPRHEFVAGADLVHSITGHSIPREETVRHILAVIPEVEPDQRVMHVGGGSGYLAAVLSELAHHVIYVDKDMPVADAAKLRFQSLGLHNIEVIASPLEGGFELDIPCDTIICTTFTVNRDSMGKYLAEGGHLICLEGRAGPVPSLAMFVQKAGKLERVRTLGWVDFNRNSEQVLIDLGMVDEETLASAKIEAAAENRRLLDVLRQKLNLEETELYRSLARQRGMALIDADQLLKKLEPELFRRFSRTFLDLSRLIPVASHDGVLTLVTDDPDARTDQLERMSPNQEIECLLVTPTDFRRLWSSLDLTVKGSRFVADHSPAEADSQSKTDGDQSDVLGNGDNPISPYLVSVYESILMDAVSERASDIHIEQYGERVRIRLRVDGDLHELPQYQLSPREIKGVINVIKLRAELNIAEHRLPQGGRSRLRLRDVKYDLRIQTQPSLHGEHAIVVCCPRPAERCRLRTLEYLR